MVTHWLPWKGGGPAIGDPAARPRCCGELDVRTPADAEHKAWQTGCAQSDYETKQQSGKAQIPPSRSTYRRVGFLGTENPRKAGGGQPLRVQFCLPQRSVTGHC